MQNERTPQPTSTQEPSTSENLHSLIEREQMVRKDIEDLFTHSRNVLQQIENIDNEEIRTNDTTPLFIENEQMVRQAIESEFVHSINVLQQIAKIELEEIRENEQESQCRMKEREESALERYNAIRYNPTEKKQRAERHRVAREQDPLKKDVRRDCEIIREQIFHQRLTAECDTVSVITQLHESDTEESDSEKTARTDLWKRQQSFFEGGINLLRPGIRFTQPSDNGIFENCSDEGVSNHSSPIMPNRLAANSIFSGQNATENRNPPRPQVNNLTQSEPVQPPSRCCSIM